MGPGFGLVTSLLFSDDGRHVAYLARSIAESRWQLVVDGALLSSHDRIRSPCFAGDRPVFGAADGQVWRVGGGPALDDILEIACGPTGRHVAYVGMLEGRAVVFEDGRELGRYAEADAPVFSGDGRTLAYVAADGAESWVQLADRRVLLSRPVSNTLVLSNDGAHFALLAAGPRGAPALYIDGVAVRDFDFEEPAALALKRGVAPPGDQLRRWMRAELIVYLEETGAAR